MSIKVFISYSHVDQGLHEKLQEHLSSLIRTGEVSIWQDQEIPAGVDWENQIDIHLNEADLILLLISASFIDSNYCWNKEVQKALERHKAGMVRVVPIVLKPTYWQNTPIGQLQALPTRAKPITQWEDQDAAFENVVRGIQCIVEELHDALPQQAASLLPPQPKKSDKPDSSFMRKVVPPPLKRLPLRLQIVIIALIFCIVPSSILLYVINPFVANQPSLPVAPTPPPFSNGIGVFKAPDGDTIGISDGYPFDTGRPDGTDKINAINALQRGATGEAFATWRTAINEDPSDGEAAIYLEDQQVLDSGNPYIDVVVGVPLGNRLYTCHAILQGAYVAQHEYNQSHNVKLRILIASSGTQPLYVTTVTQQIVHLAKVDSHAVALMGWTASDSSLNAESLVVKAPLVMLSQSASSSLLTNISPYFFRIVPADQVQAVIGAEYAIKNLGTHTLALFVDPADPYSEDLGPAFAKEFTARDGKVVATKYFRKKGPPEQFKPLLDDALKNNPDLIYFAGNSQDLSNLMTILSTIRKPSNLHIMTGDTIGGIVLPQYSGIVYTAFATPDAWKAAGVNQPLFVDEYSNTFSGNGNYKGYGFTIPSAYTILSYDAMQTLLTGCQMVLRGGHSAVTPKNLRDALSQIRGVNAIQGVSGQISFASNNDPIKKPVFLLGIRRDGNSYLLPNGIQGGCYVKGCV